MSLHTDIHNLFNIAIPIFPLQILVFKELLHKQLGMKLAPGSKLQFYQHASNVGTKQSINFEDDIWYHLLPEGSTFVHTAYKVAGHYVGDDNEVKVKLAQDTKQWSDLIDTVNQIVHKPVYPTFLAIKLSINPTTKFGHHFAYHPPSVTRTTAEQTRQQLTATIAKLIGANSTIFHHDTHPERAINLRTFLPSGRGGLGLTDPMRDRLIAFVSNVINTLPILLSNTIVRERLTATEIWKKNPSTFIREMHLACSIIASIIREEILDLPPLSNHTIIHATECNMRAYLQKTRRAALPPTWIPPSVLYNRRYRHHKA
jgi:hypothetical protein